ncbi:GntR family transcriptional regulator [Pleomorphochaeta sp. DL1XJH-081]|jgi:DNA-binding GntR family transcriptional regulator|uniref:GntR family transcriptional regulator n=1 Tax=Pleomorphochaeta sp. DL1XJH-081 TaxID=3409690 RepID=UPI003BB778F1
MINQKLPRYAQVYARLKKQIESHAYKVGEFLPPEPELEKIFHVSRTTVRKAVEMLSQEGLVYIQQGRGTEVLNVTPTQQLQYVTSFSETLREQGFQVEYDNISVEIIHASVEIAELLQVAPGKDIIRLNRTAIVKEKPLALITNFLLADILPNFTGAIIKMKSLYEFLESEYNLVIDSANDFITAKPATKEESKELEISMGYPLLQVKRISFIKARPIEFVLLRIIGDKYEYFVHTKERPPHIIR